MRGLLSNIRGRLQRSGTQADKPLVSAYLSTQNFTECRNILITTQGHFVPRTKGNLSLLHAYVRRRYKTKNIFDRRTKAWKYLKAHDSEAERTRL